MAKMNVSTPKPVQPQVQAPTPAPTPAPTRTPVRKPSKFEGKIKPLWSRNLGFEL